VLLTGEVKGDPWPMGVIIGMPEGFRKYSEQTRRMFGEIIFVSFWVIGIFLTLVVSYMNLISESQKNITLVIVQGLLLVFVVIGMFWPRAIFGRRGIPSDLRT
jgi:hypothetical protein